MVRHLNVKRLSRRLLLRNMWDRKHLWNRPPHSWSGNRQERPRQYHNRELFEV